MQKTIYSPAEREDSILLLTSLLVRYPEVCKINYFSRNQLLKLTFILRTKLSASVLRDFKEELKTCVSTYLYYELKRNPQKLTFSSKHESGLTTIEITRDTSTLTQNEINLIVELFHERFDQVLAVEDVLSINDDLAEQDDSIQTMLETFKYNTPKESLLVLREGRRVFVFKP